MSTPRDVTLSCPTPLLRHDTIQLAHGGGGRLSRELVERLFAPAFANPSFEPHHDAAALSLGSERLALTTDSYVVRPRFFPGGDIGSLSVYGTVNDLAVTGARPAYLSAAFVLEEGLPVDELARIVESMRQAAERSGVALVTGDTKVVDRGKGDGVYINTTGVGIIADSIALHPSRVRLGDAVLVSGDIGRHGVAVLSVREGLAFETTIESDCASIAPLAFALLQGGIVVHCLRDPTRGGLATVLNEIALDGGVAIEVDEGAVPVSTEVSSACEILGLDPLYVACEGRLVAFVPESDAERALSALRALPDGAGAMRIGRVVDDRAGTVTLRTQLGGRRLLDLLSGEQLPRIC